MQVSRVFLLLLPLAACSAGDDPALAPAPLAAPTLSTLKLTVDGTRLRDELGREVLLRGVNAGGRSKIAPFFPFRFQESGRADQADAPPFAEAAAAYVERIRAFGHDVVRLPFTWEAVEPTRGTYDELFLGRYGTLVDTFGAKGLRVIVDFHQDVFAQPYCGDGFPLWAVPAPVPEKPADCTDWFTGYFKPDTVGVAYDRFWKNEDGLRDAFEAMWTHVATAMAGKKNVIGFEIINEPGWGTAEAKAWPKDVLTPFYTKLGAVIRKAAPGALLFFDSTGADAISAATAVGLPEGGGMIFAPHYYAGEVIALKRYDGGDVAGPIGQWKKAADAFGVPVLLGEFGILPAAEGAAAYLRANFDALDAHLMHGTAWEYSTTADDWNGEGMSIGGLDGAETPTTPELARVYPMAVAGTIVSFTFDAATTTAVLVYDATAGGTTEIAAPARLFPNGTTVTVSGVGAATSEVGERVLVWAEGADRATATILRR